MLNQPFTSFYGPQWNELCIGEATHFMTLTHWIEAKKFDLSKHSEVISELLMMQSDYDARKFSRQHSAFWRTDWPLIKMQAVTLGVAYYLIGKGGSTAYSDSIVGEIKRAGFSGQIAALLLSQGVEASKAPRVCILAEKAVPLVQLNKRLRLISKRYPNGWILSQWRGRNTNWLIHDWALSAGVPIQYSGKKNQRTLGTRAVELAECADHFCVFDRKGDRRTDRTVSQLKAAGKDVEIVLWQSEQVEDMFS